MTIRPIVITGEPVLHRRAEPVQSFDGELAQLVADMFETMDAAHGVGLAAPQIGVDLRVFTWEMENDDGVPTRGVIVNPFVSATKASTEEPDPHDEAEGCLSVPGESFPLKRGERASVTGFDIDGNELSFEATGWFARCMQHEYDHLNGFLYVDRLNDRWAKKARKAVKRQGWGTPGFSWMPGVDPDPFGHDDADHDHAHDPRSRRAPARPLTMSRPAPPARPLVVAVVGATATGKSDLGLDLAERLGGEIVNADASQLYRGMDIGTAKVPLAQRRGIPHHQLDVIEVTDEASVAAYQAAARADLHAIQARGVHPIVVGGSGLYVRAALDVLEIPPTVPAVRARWEERARELGVQQLFGLLAERDPMAAAAIDPRNARRIVRALEVIELTGRPFSASMPRRELVQPAVLLGLRAPRDQLDTRIDARVARMWAEGLLAEVRHLEQRGLREGRTASRALGYAQALAQLDGTMTQEQAQEETSRLTRRFARRQESWFGADDRVHWLDAGCETTQASRLEQALAVVRAAIRDNGSHG